MAGSNTSRYWAGRRVLVTGATGIVGAYLVKELLRQRAVVVALVQDADAQSELYRSGDITRIAVVNGSLEDFRAIERAINLHEVQDVFHLGAQTIVGTAFRFPLATFETNIRGTYNLLEVCRVHSSLVESVVIASSDKAYGDQEHLPYTEDAPLLGRHPYDVSKSCADMLAQTYHHTYGLPVGIARCGNVYGGGDLNWSRLVPGAIRAFLLNERFAVRSDGAYVRDYIYVKDIALAYMHLARGLADESLRGEAFNFSNEHPLTVMELLKLLQGVMGADSAEIDVRNTAVAEIRLQTLAASKARSVLGWAPEYDHQRGLAETVDWYRSFLAI